MRKKILVAPTYGTVQKITPNSIEIYIGVTDNHQIFAPLTGDISNIEYQEGEFRHTYDVGEYVVEKTKRGRAIILVTDDENNKIPFWIEVGRGYVTNRIQIDKNIGERVKQCKITHVQQGERIGEIKLGSLSQIHLPENSIATVKKGDIIIGGQTQVAQLVDIPHADATSEFSINSFVDLEFQNYKREPEKIESLCKTHFKNIDAQEKCVEKTRKKVKNFKVLGKP
jgi:hypothetical protein